MKKLLVLSIATFFIYDSFCQDVRLSFSNDFKIAEKHYKDQAVTNSVYEDNHFFTVTNDGVSGTKWLFTKLYDIKFSATLQKYDKDMNLVKELKVDNGNKNFGPLMPKLLLFNKQLLLASFKSDDDQSFSLYLRKINDDDLSTDTPEKICTIKQENVGAFKIESLINSGIIYFCMSPDNQKMLLACKSAVGKIQIYVLNDKLNVVNKGIANINLSDFTIPSAVVTSDNKACLVLKGKEETKIICFNSDGKKSDIHYRAEGEMDLNVTKVKLAKDGKKIYIFSTNTNTELAKAWCNGFEIAQIDCNTLKLSKPLKYDFTPEFMALMVKKGAAVKHKRNYYIYNFNPELVELNNGKIAIVGSPKGIQTTDYSSFDANGNYRSKSASEMKVGPVIIFFPDENGKTFNETFVPRECSFVRVDVGGVGPIQIIHPLYMPESSTGFVVSTIQNKILIIYNDNSKNLSIAENEKAKVSKSESDLALAEALIDEDRKLEYRKLLSEKQQGRATYYLENAIPTSSNSIVFPIGKAGIGFKSNKTFYSKWCFVDLD